MTEAFWISPKGDIFEVIFSHIRTILDDPQKFDLKKDYILKIYKKYNEKIGIEGKARGEIMLALMKNGWIRIRYSPKQDSWTIQSYNFLNREINNTWQWLIYADNNRITNKYADYKIMIIKDDKIISGSIFNAIKNSKEFENIIIKEGKE